MTTEATELATSDNDQLVTVAPAQTVIDEIDPRSVLPPHLQTRSFDRDIWDRMKTHPLRNPTLFRDKLDDDTESREIIRQVISAAQQRESEILLHNQSRVFAHILGRAFSQISTFMSTPMLPAFRPIEPAAATVNVNPDSPGAEEKRAKKLGLFATLFGWIVTPKYILFVLVGFLGIATGWSQLELQHLRQASDSFKKSVALNDELQSSMEKTINDGEKTVTALQEQLDTAKQETANVRSNLNQTENDLKVATQTITNKDEEIATLKQEMQQLRASLKLGEDEKDKAIEKLNVEKQNLIEKLASTDANLKIANAEKLRLGNVENEKQALANQLTIERKEKNRRVADLQSQLNSLMLKEYILIDALACIQSVEREIGSIWSKPERIKKYLETFRLQEQTRKSTVTGG